MNRYLVIFFLILAAVFIATTFHAHATNLITAGSFEDIPATIYPEIPGWTTTRGCGVTVRSTYPAANGSNYVELDTHDQYSQGCNSSSAIQSQETYTTPGSTYTLSFSYSPRPANSGNSIEVVWEGTIIDTIDIDGTGNVTTVWTTHTYTVVAVNSPSLLELGDRSVEDDKGGYVDNVSLVEVPATKNLTITRAGSGSGTVTSSPAGISCGADCSEAYNTNTVVTLTATPSGDSSSIGWTGDADCTDGSVTMSADVACTATFNLFGASRHVELENTPTPSPTPLPSVTPSPTPTPSIPTFFITPSIYGLTEGDIISTPNSNDPDIYIINDFGYKRLFLNPIIFSFYGHLGSYANVKSVSTTTRDAFLTSGLFRNCETNDQKVYALEVTGEDTGILHWVNLPGSQAVSEDPHFFQKVFCINTNEFNWYTESDTLFGLDYTSVSQMPSYVR